jgi:hypothetical protein
VFERKQFQEQSSIKWIILVAAVVKFAIQIYIAPGYGFFGDELYTIALSRHLAFGYVDLPPLVPALVAASRALMGDSILALHIVPAFAGAVTLVIACLITKELGGKSFAVLLSAITFIAVPLWLMLDSIFCYDSIDQMVLAVFLFVVIRFLKTGNRKMWLLLGLIAGIACMTKMTMLFLGPGFLAALLISKYRKDLLSPWPWLGGALCVVIVSPYLIWQVANQWPTLEYWNNYGTIRVYQATIPQYLTNILVYMNPFLLPMWIIGVIHIIRRYKRIEFSFPGMLFLFTLILMFSLHASARMLAELFIPIIAASAIFIEELLAGIRWGIAVKALVTAYLLYSGFLVVPASLPIFPLNRLPEITQSSKKWTLALREFKGGTSATPLFLSGRLGWDELVRLVAGVYQALPAEERAVAGIYTSSYMQAGAIDQLGPQYGLPHAVSGSLTYYLWGPGYSWDVMILVTNRTNSMAVFFDKCEEKATFQYEYDAVFVGNPTIFVCRGPKVNAEEIWSSQKTYR